MSLGLGLQVGDAALKLKDLIKLKQTDYFKSGSFDPSEPLAWGDTDAPPAAAVEPELEALSRESVKHSGSSSSHESPSGQSQTAVPNTSQNPPEGLYSAATFDSTGERVKRKVDEMLIGPSSQTVPAGKRVRKGYKVKGKRPRIAGVGNETWKAIEGLVGSQDVGPNSAEYPTPDALIFGIRQRGLPLTARLEANIKKLYAALENKALPLPVNQQNTPQPVVNKMMLRPPQGRIATTGSQVQALIPIAPTVTDPEIRVTAQNVPIGIVTSVKQDYSSDIGGQITPMDVADDSQKATPGLYKTTPQGLPTNDQPSQTYDPSPSERELPQWMQSVDLYGGSDDDRLTVAFGDKFLDFLVGASHLQAPAAPGSGQVGLANNEAFDVISGANNGRAPVTQADMTNMQNATETMTSQDGKPVEVEPMTPGLGTNSSPEQNQQRSTSYGNPAASADRDAKMSRVLEAATPFLVPGYFTGDVGGRNLKRNTALIAKELSIGGFAERHSMAMARAVQQTLKTVLIAGHHRLGTVDPTAPRGDWEQSWRSDIRRPRFLSESGIVSLKSIAKRFAGDEHLRRLQLIAPQIMRSAKDKYVASRELAMREAGEYAEYNKLMQLNQLKAMGDGKTEEQRNEMRRLMADDLDVEGLLSNEQRVDPNQKGKALPFVPQSMFPDDFGGTPIAVSENQGISSVAKDSLLNNISQGSRGNFASGGNNGLARKEASDVLLAAYRGTDSQNNMDLNARGILSASNKPVTRYDRVYRSESRRDPSYNPGETPHVTAKDIQQVDFDEMKSLYNAHARLMIGGTQYRNPVNPMHFPANQVGELNKLLSDPLSIANISSDPHADLMTGIPKAFKVPSTRLSAPLRAKGEAEAAPAPKDTTLDPSDPSYKPPIQGAGRTNQGGGPASYTPPTITPGIGMVMHGQYTLPAGQQGSFLPSVPRDEQSKNLIPLSTTGDDIYRNMSPDLLKMGHDIATQAVQGNGGDWRDINPWNYQQFRDAFIKENPDLASLAASMADASQSSSAVTDQERDQYKRFMEIWQTDPHIFDEMGVKPDAGDIGEKSIFKTGEFVNPPNGEAVRNYARGDGELRPYLPIGTGEEILPIKADAYRKGREAALQAARLGNLYENGTVYDNQMKRQNEWQLNRQLEEGDLGVEEYGPSGSLNAEFNRWSGVKPTLQALDNAQRRMNAFRNPKVPTMTLQQRVSKWHQWNAMSQAVQHPIDNSLLANPTCTEVQPELQDCTVQPRVVEWMPALPGKLIYPKNTRTHQEGVHRALALRVRV